MATQEFRHTSKEFKLLVQAGVGIYTRQPDISPKNLYIAAQIQALPVDRHRQEDARGIKPARWRLRDEVLKELGLKVRVCRVSEKAKVVEIPQTAPPDGSGKVETPATVSVLTDQDVIREFITRMTSGGGNHVNSTVWENQVEDRLQAVEKLVETLLEFMREVVRQDHRTGPNGTV